MFRKAEIILASIATLLGFPTPAAPKTGRFVPVTEQLRQEARRRQPLDELSLIPRYPPFDHGLPFISVDKILQTQEDILKRIKLQAGLHEAEYERIYVPVLQNYAKFVHLLPATQDDYHRGAGGLIRMGLEVGFFSLQASSGVIFSGRETAGTRRIQEPRWRYVTFIAGMCYEIYRVLTQMIVTTEDGEQWPCYTVSLHDWLEKKNVDRYFITWVDTNQNSSATHHASSFVINKILPELCVQYIAEAGNELVPVLMSVVSGTTSRSYADPVYNIVTRAQAGVVDRDRKANPAAYGKVTVGSHLERYLIDAIRNLVRKQWHVNQRKARCWYSAEGVFVIWQSGAKDVWELLQKQKLPGVPEAPETLAEVMLSAGVILPNQDGTPYWTIYPPHSSSPDGYRAIKFKNKETIFDHVLLHGADASDGVGKQNPVAPIEVSLLKPPARPSKPLKGALPKKNAKGESGNLQQGPVPATPQGVVADGTADATAGQAEQCGAHVETTQCEPDCETTTEVPAHGGEQGSQRDERGDLPTSEASSSPLPPSAVATWEPVQESFADIIPDIAETPFMPPGGGNDALSLLSDTARLMLESLRDDYNGQKFPKTIFLHGDAIAVTSLEIGTRGISKTVMDELLAKGVLVRNERGSALHKIARGSDNTSCALINVEFALKAGFISIEP